jgi:hypothetical protein
MIAKGYIDPNHLYVTAVAMNWYSFVLTSDIGNWTSKGRTVSVLVA